MLVMTRRIGERMVIGSNITLTILSVQGNQVRIGVDAPRIAPSTAKRSIDGSSSNGRQSIKSGFSEPRKPGALLEPLGRAPR
jgi:carbon storage regulator